MAPLTPLWKRTLFGTIVGYMTNNCDIATAVGADERRRATFTDFGIGSLRTFGDRALRRADDLGQLLAGPGR